MIIAAEVGTTFSLGPYVVRIALRQDNPAFARYLVFRKGRIVGRQFSRPSLPDCQWLEYWGEKYANVSMWHESSRSSTSSALDRRKRGRAERDKTLALSA